MKEWTFKPELQIPKLTSANKEKMVNLSKTHKIEFQITKWLKNEVYYEATATYWFINKKTGEADYFLKAGEEIIRKNV